MGTKVEFREAPALYIGRFLCFEGPLWHELARICPEDGLNLPAKLSPPTLNPTWLTKGFSNDTIVMVGWMNKEP